MLTEAASLRSLLAISARMQLWGALLVCIPSVVVIAIDVEDLVTLHTQDTGQENVREDIDSIGFESSLPRQHALGQAWGEGQYSVQWNGGVATNRCPAPRRRTRVRSHPWRV